MKRYQKYIAAALTICLTTSATFYYAESAPLAVQVREFPFL